MTKRHILTILMVSTFFSVIASLSFISFFQSSCAEAQTCVPLPIPTVTPTKYNVSLTDNNGRGGGWKYNNSLPAISNAYCSLAGAGFTDMDAGGEWGRCLVDISGGTWRLGGYSESGKDIDVECQAYCVVW